jgi:hypothetical protein
VGWLATEVDGPEFEAFLMARIVRHVAQLSASMSP